MLLISWGCGGPGDLPTHVPVESVAADPQTALLGTEVVVTATVFNDVAREVIYPVRLLVNGAMIETVSLPVGPKSRGTATFRYPLASPGKYRFTVGSHAVEVTALHPATFYVSCLVVKPERARVGESVMVEATVFNVGDVGGVYEANLTVNSQQVAGREVRFDGGREQQTVSFQYVPEEAGARTVLVGDQAGSFTAIPKDGSLLRPPTALGDVKVLTPTGLSTAHPFQLGGFTHIHGAAYDTKRGLLWLTEAIYPLVSGVPDLYQNHIYAIEVGGCGDSRPVPVAHIQVPAGPADEQAIEELAYDQEDDTLYYLDHSGTVFHIDTEGNPLRQFSTVVEDHPAFPPGPAILGFWGLAVQGDYVWVANHAALHQFNKKTGAFSGAIIPDERVGLAHDADRNLLWAGNWEDGRFTAWDPDTLEKVFESQVVQLPGIFGTAEVAGTDMPNCCGHNLAYGEGRLWFGTENLGTENVYGIRVK